jgi:hypothetical protein
MKSIIFSLAFLLISLTSCKSPKASDFREAIIQKERVAFVIVLGKHGSETQKLERLIKNDYKGALTLVDKQAREFDKLIKDIEALPAKDIKQGNALKNAAINYYTALKELHYFDRKEIAQSEAILQLKNEELRAAQHNLVELARQKKALYEKLYKQEGVFHDALQKFNSVNHM